MSRKDSPYAFIIVPYTCKWQPWHDHQKRESKSITPGTYPLCSWHASILVPFPFIIFLAGLQKQAARTAATMSGGSGFPGFHNHGYDRDYARPLFRVSSFSDNGGGKGQERYTPSPPQERSMSRTTSTVAVAPRLSPSVSKLSMKNLQQVVNEKSLEDEGIICQPILISGSVSSGVSGGWLMGVVQRWSWWRRSTPSCFLERTCLGVGRVSARLWPSPMPSPIYMVVQRIADESSVKLVFDAGNSGLTSVLVLGCSNCVWNLPQVEATASWEEGDVEQGDGLPPLHLRIHCWILTKSPGHARWKHSWCNSIARVSRLTLW